MSPQPLQLWGGLEKLSSLQMCPVLDAVSLYGGHLNFDLEVNCVPCLNCLFKSYFLLKNEPLAILTSASTSVAKWLSITMALVAIKVQQMLHVKIFIRNLKEAKP